MKQIKTLTFALAIVALLFGSSCKYQESGLSLRSKKSRITNLWKLENTEDASAKEFRLEIKKDGSGNYYFTTNPSARVDFNWEFDDTKEYIVIKEGNDPENKVKILRLKKKSLWLGDDVADAEKYVPAD